MNNGNPNVSPDKKDCILATVGSNTNDPIVFHPICPFFRFLYVKLDYGLKYTVICDIRVYIVALISCFLIEKLIKQ